MKTATRKTKALGKIRKKYQHLKTYLPAPPQIDQISQVLTKQIGKEIFKKKYAGVADVLKLVGAGLLLAGSVVVPKLPKAFAPFFKEDEYEAWKRFNIPYLKRTLKRLEKQKLVEIDEEKDMQVVKITEDGRKRVLRYALDELAVEKPKVWNGSWWLVSYDLPKEFINQREILRDYLRAWGFYPLHESVFLHAYPCYKQVEFLREYLGMGEFLRIFKVSAIENNQPFKEFFNL